MSQNFLSPKKINENNTLYISNANKENIEVNTQKIINLEPKGIINLSEYQLTEQIGKGSYGKIFCVRWKKNNKLYALKQEILDDLESIQKRKDNWKIIQNFSSFQFFKFFVLGSSPCCVYIITPSSLQEPCTFLQDFKKI